MDVFFRFDDLAARSWFARHAGDLQLAVLDQFAAANVPLTVAAIPVATDSREHHLTSDQVVCDAFASAVGSGQVDPAVHGFDHRDFAARELRRRSEFVGRDFSAQRRALRTGKQIVEQVVGQPVGTFVPPWNTYDQTTVAAVEDAGFHVLSASTRPVLRPRKGRSLQWLPVTVELRELVDILARHPNGLPSGTILGVVFHVYDFLESGDPRAWTPVKDLTALLKRCQDAGFSISTISQLASRPIDLGLQRYRANVLACRFASIERLPRLVLREHSAPFTQWYWPRKSIWLRLTQTCTPLAEFRRPASI